MHLLTENIFKNIFYFMKQMLLKRKSFSSKNWLSANKVCSYKDIAWESCKKLKQNAIKSWYII